MKILHITRSLDPAGGGPPEGIRQFALVHQSHRHRVEVATLDAPDAPWLRDFPAPAHGLGPASSKYGYSARLGPWLERHAPRFDGIVVNGLWQYHGFAAHSVLTRLGKPYCVYPHGMLDPWFKRRYPLKHLKKWLYWPWVEYRLLRDAQHVLFTAEEERRLARESFWLYRANEAVVGYGIAEPPAATGAQAEAFLAAFPRLRGRRYLLFMSRLHPKKGLDLLVEAFGAMASRIPDWDLVIAGPDGDGLGAGLQSRVAALGATRRVHWTGMLAGDAKWGALRGADAFVLPSHQENFGIVIAEALACGVPVLMSDKINIWREVEQGRAGLVEPDTPQGTAALLRTWTGYSDAERDACRGRTLACFRKHFHIESTYARLMAALRLPVDAATTQGL
jgi:glycosyltransferase involved in cell wall biosynthesis